MAYFGEIAKIQIVYELDRFLSYFSFIIYSTFLQYVQYSTEHCTGIGRKNETDQEFLQSMLIKH